MNIYAIRAIYKFEMARTWRTLMQSIIAPVISTSLYFVVFGAAIGSRIKEVDGISYGAFIVPGLIMLSLLSQSISNASFGIYFPRFTGTIYELLSAPVSYLEIVVSYVGAAATKSILLGLIILATAGLFVPLQVEHPLTEMLCDIDLDATLRFGAREMSLHEVLELGPGTVVELDRHIAEPVDLLVGDRIVARGEVVVVSGNFALRVTEVATPQLRLESIRCFF